jgi:hypothetical protein
MTSNISTVEEQGQPGTKYFCPSLPVTLAWWQLLDQQKGVVGHRLGRPILLLGEQLLACPVGPAKGTDHTDHVRMRATPSRREA